MPLICSYLLDSIIRFVTLFFLLPTTSPSPNGWWLHQFHFLNLYFVYYASLLLHYDIACARFLRNYGTLNPLLFIFLGFNLYTFGEFLSHTLPVKRGPVSYLWILIFVLSKIFLYWCAAGRNLRIANRINPGNRYPPWWILHRPFFLALSLFRNLSSCHVDAYMNEGVAACTTRVLLQGECQVNEFRLHFLYIVFSGPTFMYNM